MTTPVVPRPAVVAVSIAFAATCMLPYGVAAARTPPHTQFKGVLLNHLDQTYYLAAQRSVARRLPTRNRFTSEPGAPGPIAPLYPLLGRVQRATGLPALVVYHLPRMLAVLALPSALAFFFGLCFPLRRDAAVWGVLLTLFASGGYTLGRGLPLMSRSSDSWVPEANALISSTVFPHFAVSYVGVVLAFSSLAMCIRGRSVIPTLGVGAVAGALLGLGHSFLLLPYLAVLVMVVVGSLPATRVRVRDIGRFLPALALLVPLAPVLYSLHAEQARFEQLQGQGFPTTPSDVWWTWVLGFGVLSPLAVAGAVYWSKPSQRDAMVRLLAWWAILQTVLLFTPVPVFQRRFSEGLVVPIAAFAAFAVSQLAASARPVLAGMLRLSLGALLIAGPVLILQRLGSDGLYVSDDVIALAQTVESDDLVLSNDALSDILPAFSDVSVFTGRTVETLHYRQKRLSATHYAQDPTSRSSREWLLREGISVIVVDRRDLSFAPRALADRHSCVRSTFDRAYLGMYRVDRACLMGSQTGPARGG